MAPRDGRMFVVQVMHMLADYIRGRGDQLGQRLDRVINHGQLLFVLIGLAKNQSQVVNIGRLV